MTIYNDPARALRDSPLRAWNISLRRERVAFNARRRRPSLLTGRRDRAHGDTRSFEQSSKVER